MAFIPSRTGTAGSPGLINYVSSVLKELSIALRRAAIRNALIVDRTTI